MTVHEIRPLSVPNSKPDCAWCDRTARYVECYRNVIMPATAFTPLCPHHAKRLAADFNVPMRAKEPTP